MIPKVVRSRDGKGSGGTGFKGAVEYVSTKADAVTLRNLHDLSTAPREMRAVANESRAGKPVYHFILSWAELERPTNEQAFAAADQALQALGLEHHQAVIAIHRDRDHHHVHVVVNKRGLDGRTADLSHDYVRLEKACREVEHHQGWAQDRGHFSAVIGDDGRVNLAAKPAGKKTRQDTDRERHTGQEALSKFLSRDDLHPQLASVIDSAATWEQLQTGLNSLGLRYEAKGSGARLVSTTDPTDSASPSHIDKQWARSKLEQRLGPMPIKSPPPVPRGEDHEQQHLAAVGRNPPPAARNRLRNLSELDVVRFADRGEGVLSGDVSGGVVNAGAERNHSVRRPGDRVAPGDEATPPSPYQEARERLWQAFQQHNQAAYQQAVQQRRQGREALYQRHQAERAQLIARQRHRRKTLDILFGYRGVTRWIFRKWDARRRGAEWEEIKARQKSEMDAHRKGPRDARQPKPEWRAFVADQVKAGNRDAELVAKVMKLSRAPDVQRAAGYGNSAAELEAMRRIDFIRLAQDMGYRVDTRESTKGSVKLRNGADVVIAQPGPDGAWNYFSTGDDRDNGGVIQFVRHRRGGTLGDVRQFLRPYLDGSSDSVSAPAPEPMERERDHTAARQAWMAAKAVVPPYLQQRGIERITIEALANDEVRQDQRGNVLFAHRDQNGNLVGFEVKGKTWSGFANGGQKTLAIFGTPEARRQPARIVIVESGIDALSLGQMEQRRDTLYVSTGGAMGRRTLEELRRLAARHPTAKLFLGFDNDEAGHKLAERVVANLGRVPERLQPQRKDWNEDLQARRQQPPQHEKVRERTRSRGAGM